MEKYLSEIFSAWCLDTKQLHNKDSIASLRVALSKDCTSNKIVLRSQRIGVNTAAALGKLLMDQPQIHTLDLHENVIRCKGVAALVDTFMTISENNKRAQAKKESRQSMQERQNRYRRKKEPVTSRDSDDDELRLDLDNNSSLSSLISNHKCNIIHLNLGSNDIGKRGMEILAEWLAHDSCKLRTLILGCEKDELYGNKLDSESASKIAINLRKNSTLTTLDLNLNEEIGKKDQQAFLDFAATFELSSIRSSIHSNDSSNNNNNNNFTKGELSKSMIASPTNSSILNNSMYSLSSSLADISGIAIPSNSHPSSSHTGLKSCPIQILRMGDVNMKSSSAVAIIQAFEGNSNLRYLDLSGNKLNYQVAESLARLMSGGRIASIPNEFPIFAIPDSLFRNNTNNNNTNNNNPVVGPVTNQNNKPTEWTCNLSTLLLNRNNFKSRGVQILSSALKFNTSLCVLSLSENMLGNEAAVALAEYLKNCVTLTHLDLSNNQITEEGCVILSEAIVLNPVLSHLNLSYNKIGNMGANALAKCLIQHEITPDGLIGWVNTNKDQDYIITKSKSNIINLNLNSCGVGDEGAVSICVALSCNDNLLTLGLRNNYLTEGETGKVLAEVLRLKRNENILNIDIRGNQIEHPTMLDISRSLRRNKQNRSMVHPNKLKKKLIQLKYTEHLLSEARESLRRHREDREYAEGQLEMVQQETQRILDEFEELEYEYLQQQEAEDSLISNILQRSKARQEESLLQLKTQENKLSLTMETFQEESSLKKRLEQELAHLEQELEQTKENSLAQANIIQDEIAQIRKQIGITEKSSNKLKKELNSMKKKTLALEEGVSSAIVDAIDFKIRQEMDQLQQQQLIHPNKQQQEISSEQIEDKEHTYQLNGLTSESRETRSETGRGEKQGASSGKKPQVSSTPGPKVKSEVKKSSSMKKQSSKVSVARERKQSGVSIKTRSKEPNKTKAVTTTGKQLLTSLTVPVSGTFDNVKGPTPLKRVDSKGNRAFIRRTNSSSSTSSIMSSDGGSRGDLRLDITDKDTDTTSNSFSPSASPMGGGMRHGWNQRLLPLSSSEIPTDIDYDPVELGSRSSTDDDLSRTTANVMKVTNLEIKNRVQ